METFEPPKYITSLIASINDGAKSAQTGALAFAAIGLYLLATAFSATDEDLLLDRTLAISQLSAQIPVTVSFAMMPILFVALHVFTLIRYDMLAANVNQFREDLMILVPEERDRERCRQLLANVEFIQSLTAPPGSPLRSRLFGLVAWVVIAAFPIIVLLAVQINALRYQSEVVTNVQRLSLLIDLALLAWFYNRRRRQQVTNPDVSGVALRRWAMCLWMPMIVVIADLAWLNIPASEATTVEPSEVRYSSRWEKWKAVAAGLSMQPLDLFLCPELNWGCRFLRVDHRLLVGRVWDSKAIVELGAGQPLTDERRAGFEGVFMRSRTLRFADLSESRLYAADLITTDLTGAVLTAANLTGADLFLAGLSGADLSRGHLARANLLGANLINASLTNADLTNADLVGANLTNADLTEANLTNADLFTADLTNVDMTNADLFTAKVEQVQLDLACGSHTKLPRGLTLKPCSKPK